MKKLCALFTVLLLISILAGCASEEPAAYPKELYFQGGQPYLEEVTITCDDPMGGTPDHVAVYLPEGMFLEGFHATAMAKPLDGGESVQIMSEKDLAPGKHFIIKDISGYESIGILLWYEYDGVQTSQRHEEFILKDYQK